MIGARLMVKPVMVVLFGSDNKVSTPLSSLMTNGIPVEPPSTSSLYTSTEEGEIERVGLLSAVRS